MDGRSPTAHVPLAWRALAIVVAVALNVVVLWRGVDLIGSAPPAESRLSTATAGAPSVSLLIAPEPEGAAVAVTITPDASGKLALVERVRTEQTVRRLVLRSPPATPDRRSPRVLALTIEADGRSVTVPPSAGGRWLVPLPAPAAYVVLRYRLGGATERRPGAPDRRVLLRVRPLTSSATLSATVPATALVEVDGATVHNLVCPDRPLADQLCGRQIGDRWRTAPLPLREATVVAQIDLPVAPLPT